MKSTQRTRHPRTPPTEPPDEKLIVEAQDRPELLSDFAAAERVEAWFEFLKRRILPDPARAARLRAAVGFAPHRRLGEPVDVVK